MNLEFSEKFYKDLDSISSKMIQKKLINLIEKIEEAESIKEVLNLKKLSGYQEAYRIRLGDYRIGLFIRKDVILLARILHRKEIYRKFP